MTGSKSVIDMFFDIDAPWKLIETERKDYLTASIGQPGATIATNVRRAKGADEKGCGRHVAELSEQINM